MSGKKKKLVVSLNATQDLDCHYFNFSLNQDFQLIHSTAPFNVNKWINRFLWIVGMAWLKALVHFNLRLLTLPGSDARLWGIMIALSAHRYSTPHKWCNPFWKGSLGQLALMQPPIKIDLNSYRMNCCSIMAKVEPRALHPILPFKLEDFQKVIINCRCTRGQLNYIFCVT